nr:uncharacterized protein LOC109189578 isoform X1 [Ipomoea trifida]
MVKSRASKNQFINVVQDLNQAQRDVVVEIGFGSMLNLEIGLGGHGGLRQGKIERSYVLPLVQLYIRHSDFEPPFLTVPDLHGHHQSFGQVQLKCSPAAKIERETTDEAQKNRLKDYVTVSHGAEIHSIFLALTLLYKEAQTSLRFTVLKGTLKTLQENRIQKDKAVVTAGEGLDCQHEVQDQKPIIDHHDETHNHEKYCEELSQLFEVGLHANTRIHFSIVVACLRSEVLSTHPGRGIPQFSPLATTHVICCVLGVTAFVCQRVAGDLGQSDGRRLGSYNEQTAGTTRARCQFRCVHGWVCRGRMKMDLKSYPYSDFSKIDMVIDNAFAPTAKKKKYGDSLKDMQDMLSEFFDKIHAGRSVLCAGLVPKRMQMP